ncbi:uncharacterized protein ACHE_50493S [Aspergillus chevalieri]|uniref:Uncharacterized protein n=1 Tax=Aspergillus chevalieri TaxID=182096 RepID=A0A7R7VR48_ASPCH|nr:uncharacterized protein ACHE_50493S [Aspergillus chevalieri]BCR89295.1 hypothetical protein ACHE_50493S [Aspergillus chevalieri]
MGNVGHDDLQSDSDLERGYEPDLEQGEFDDTSEDDSDIGNMNPSPMSHDQHNPVTQSQLVQNRNLARLKKKGIKRQAIVSITVGPTSAAIALALIIYVVGRARGSWS